MQKNVKKRGCISKIVVFRGFFDSQNARNRVYGLLGTRRLPPIPYLHFSMGFFIRHAHFCSPHFFCLSFPAYHFLPPSAIPPTVMSTSNSDSEQVRGASSPASSVSNIRASVRSVRLFVPGRLCIFGEHSDWAGGYRKINKDLEIGRCIVSFVNCLLPFLTLSHFDKKQTKKGELTKAYTPMSTRTLIN